MADNGFTAEGYSACSLLTQQALLEMTAGFSQCTAGRLKRWNTFVDSADFFDPVFAKSHARQNDHNQCTNLGCELVAAAKLKSAEDVPIISHQEVFTNSQASMGKSL